MTVLSAYQIQLNKQQTNCIKVLVSNDPIQSNPIFNLFYLIYLLNNKFVLFL